MVRYQGTAPAFAIDDQIRILHTVLDPFQLDPIRGEFDPACWNENPVEVLSVQRGRPFAP